MKKRLLTAALSLLMLLGVMTPTAFAKGYDGPSLTVTASETAVLPGDEITCTVVMGPVQELQSLQMEVRLPEGLTYVAGSGSLTPGLQEQFQYQALDWTDARLMINGYASQTLYSSEADTALATFRCTVDADAEGALSIGLGNLEFYCGPFGDDENVTDGVLVTPARLTCTIPVTGVTLTPETLTLEQGESETLTAAVEPGTASNQTVTYASSNPAVATVDPDGTVHALGEGEATITVTTRDGSFTATCVVTVPHKHTFGTDWSYDEDSHWHECVAGDGAVSDQAPHTGGTATCERQAVCEVCGAPYGDLAPHTLTHVDRVEPTHFADGNIEYWACSVCHKLFRDAQGTQEISRADTVLTKIPHDYSDDWSSDDTGHWHACSCGDQADVAAHSFVWVVDREPTEDQTGLKHEACTVCGFVRHEGTVIDKLDHELTFHPAVAATCVQEGNVAYYSCANCGRNFADADATQVLTNVVTPVDHDNHVGKTELKGVVEATCTQEGYSGDIYCADCGDLLQAGSVIPATGHSLERVDRVEPTHTSAGNIAYWQCTACGALFADEEGMGPLSAADVVLEQIPHSFGQAWVSDATGHWHVCLCGARSDVEQHTFGDWVTTKEATQTQAGSRQRVCTLCGYVETEALAPLVSGGGGDNGSGQNPAGQQDTGDQTAQDTTSQTASPKTGDHSLMGIGLGTLALAGVGLTILTVTGRKRRHP